MKTMISTIDNKIKLPRFAIKYKDAEIESLKNELDLSSCDDTNITGEIVIYCMTEDEAQSQKEFLSCKSNVVGLEMIELDIAGMEWLEDIEVSSSGEAYKIAEMGQEAYEAMKNIPTQDEINAMLLLRVAELTAEVKGNE